MDTRERIAIVGFMGSGKTTLGKKLSEAIGHRFIDLDELIEEKSRMKIKDIFKYFGEKHFRELETRFLKRLAQEKEIVVSCGGGIVEKEENRDILRENFFVIYLEIPFQVCLKRISGDENRPLASLETDRLLEIYRKREPLYREVSNFVLTEDHNIEDLIELLKAR